MERLCIDCKHYVEPERMVGGLMKCVALRGKPHPVLGGEVDHIDPGLMRMTLCGWNDPKFWERKSKATVKAA